MGKKRVLVLNHFAVPRDGAGGTRHVELFGRLEGWEATLIAADRNLFDRRRYRSDEIVTVPTTPYRTNGILRVLNWISYAIAAVLRGLTVPKPDVVYASSPHLLAGLAGWALSRIRRCPFVFEVRDLWPDLLVSMGQLEPTSTLLRTLERLEVFLYRKADRVVVLASGAVKAVADKGIDEAKIVFLPNAADPEDFEVHEDRAELRAKYRFDHLTFIYAGAHGPANGLQLLLDAASEIQETAPEAEIVLVGDGPSKVELVKYAGEKGLNNVRFMDPVPKTEIPRLLAASDLGLHVLADVPLFRYGVSPNKICDYLAAGLPVVTNSPGEAGQLVEESGAGVVVHPRGLSDGVLSAARCSEGQREAWASAGRRYMGEQRSRSKVAADLLLLLDGLVATS